MLAGTICCLCSSPSLLPHSSFISLLTCLTITSSIVFFFVVHSSFTLLPPFYNFHYFMLPSFFFHFNPSSFSLATVHSLSFSCFYFHKYSSLHFSLPLPFHLIFLLSSSCLTRFTLSSLFNLLRSPHLLFSFSVYLPIFLFISLYLSVCHSVYISFYLSTNPYVCLCISLY